MSAASPRPRPARRGVRRGERGAVTAEAVMVLPVLVLLTTALCWLLAVGLAQVRAVDAARETARLAARGDPDAEAIAAGAGIAPDGSRIALARADGRVRVTVTGSVGMPGGVLDGLLPGATVRAEAVGAEEDP